MSVRHVVKRVVVSVAAISVAGTFTALALTSPASATEPASGSVVPGAAAPVGAVTPGTAFSSGQSINVVIPANSAFASPDNTVDVNVVECSAPNGSVPTSTSACDSHTIQSGTILPNADGSFTYQGYPVYALPDNLTLNESPSSPVDCGNTAATECILYIGNNQGDFTQPHLWSQPFFVKANGNDGGADPGDGTAPTAGSPPSSGAVVPGSAQCSLSCATGQPFSSGQNINVVIPANDAFSSTDGLGNNHTRINVVECSAPNGVPPTSTSKCDGETIQGNTILPNADGSFTYRNYTVYALPDSVSLSESVDSPVVCGSTAATECILYIGDNQGDFTQPHLWSQPFFVTANGTDNGANPGNGTPEVPLAVLLPFSAMGLLGGTVLVRRRRTARTA